MKPSARRTMRRGLLVGLLLAPAAVLADAMVEVWVQLTLPELARVPAAQRAQAQQLIERQQDAVMQQLRALGGVEQARVRLVRNALAVRLPASALPRARAIEGVRAVTPVRHRDIHRP